MKRIVFIPVYFYMLLSIILPQTVQEKLEDLKSNYFTEIKEIKHNIYKISNKFTGMLTYKNMCEYKIKNGIKNSQVDTTVIYPDLVDTSRFSGMYDFWTSVPIGESGPFPIIVGDVNNNGKAELYGARINTYLHINERSMYEYNPDKKTFDFKTDMPWDSLGDYGSFKQIYDVNQNGEKNVFITGNKPDTDTLSGIRVARTLKINDTTNLPTDILFDYKQWYQMNDPKWGEYDNKEGTDLFYCGEGRGIIVAAARYDKNINNATTIFIYPVPEDIFYLAGLSNWDIDGDGYADLVTGGLYGDIVIFEYDNSIGNYRDVWHGDAGTYNVYIHFNTNDIDGNGKKEIWVGGAAFYNNVPITRLSCLESNGDNQYETKHVIDIVGRFSFDAYNGFAVDVDKDGTDEIGLCLDQTFMIFKFTGTENQWAFDLFYLKLNDVEQSQGIYFGALMNDVDNDGYEEILIMTDKIFNNYQDHKLFTNIYKPTDLVGVRNIENHIFSYKLYQNYPNPFNPTTKLEYEIPKRSVVKITVYNILGEKVGELVNKEQSRGNYSIKFNGSNLPSGVYLIKMTAGKYTKTIKSLLIK